MTDDTINQKLLEAFVPYPDIYELIKISETENEIQLYLKSRKTEEKCPDCEISSNKFKKKYTRKIKYDTYGGKEVILFIELHSFKCLNEECPRKTFNEELPFAQKWQQRSNKLNYDLITEIAQSGFRGSAKSRELSGLEVSHTSLRRLLSRIEFEEAENDEVKIVGIDDCAIKSGCNYMTQISKIEEERIRLLKLTQGRNAESVKEFLLDHPEIVFVARDRSNAYSSAVKKYLIGAIEVADRFHLILKSLDQVERFLKPKLPGSFRFIDGKLVENNINEISLREKEKRLNRRNKRIKAIKTLQDNNDYTQSDSSRLDKNVTILKRKDLLRLVCQKRIPDEETKGKIEELLKYYPCLKIARRFWEDFYQIIMGKGPYDLPDPDSLDGFIEKYKNSDFKSFIKSIKRDKEAVRNGIIYRFVSSGKVEGLNNKIKLIKRKGYGNYDLETLEKMIKLSYEYYHGSIDDLEFKPTARKYFETKRSKKNLNKPTFKSWFDEDD